jgi:STE24 endopeptidase
MSDMTATSICESASMGGRPRLIAALASAVVAGETALALLRPRDGVTQPRPVDATGYFSPAEIDRARAYRRGQLALGLSSTAIRLSLLLAAQRRRSPLLMTVGSTAATFPLRVLARRRALAVGLATDSWGDWARDSIKASAIGAGIGGAGTAAAFALIRAAPRRWWLPGSAVLVGASAAGALLAPVLLDPVFNEFTPLEGEPRDAVLGLAAQAGVKVGSVLSVDASRRTSAANAYVTGLGATKRVVLFDTLLDRYPAAERDLVIAHELAHVKHRDVPRQIAFLALTAPASAYAAQKLAERLDPHGVGRGRPTLGSLPALALALGAAGALTTQAAMRLSRRVENRADTYALTLRPEPDAFIDFERRIALQNLADPDPPRLLQVAFGSHPTTVQRIGIAEALRPRRRPQPAADRRQTASGPVPPAGS